MDLLSKNKVSLKLLMGFAGISYLKATTDSPAARIELSWKRHGVEHDSSFTLAELLSYLTDPTTEEQTQPQGDFTDIADLPDAENRTRPVEAETSRPLHRGVD